MSLPAPAQDPNTNVAISPMWVPYKLVNGAITGTAKLYDVNTINPSGLYYIARAYDVAGNLVLTGNYVVTGATFNLGTAVPTSVTTSNISYLTPAAQNGNNSFTGINSHSGLETFTGGINNDASPGFVTGIFNNGSGFKHQRVTGCTTTTTQFNFCTVSISWASAFADTNYTSSCSLVGTTGLGWSQINSYAAAGFSVNVVNAQSGIAFTVQGVDCIAVHD